MAEGYGFDKAGIKRVIRATQEHERQIENGTGRRLSQPSGGRDGFWAKITDHDYEDKSFSWIRQKRKDDGTFEDDDTLEGTMAGDLYATECSDYQFVWDGSVVWLVNYFDHFVFEWQYKVVYGKAEADIDDGDTGVILVLDPDFTENGEELNPARNRTGQKVKQDQQVRCEMWGDDWIIVPQKGGGTGIVTGTATAPFNSSSSTVSVDSTFDEFDEDMEIDSADNIFGLAGETGDNVALARYSAGWFVLQVSHKTKTLVHNVTINGELVQETVSVAIMTDDLAGDESTIAETDECEEE